MPNMLNKIRKWLRLMKEMTFFFVFVAVSVALIWARSYFEVPEREFNVQGYTNNQTIAVWEWREIESFDYRNSLKNLANLKVNQVYLDVSSAIEIVETSDAVAKSINVTVLDKKLHDYVSFADSLGIRVDAVVGNPNWTSEELRYINLDLFDYIVRFNDVHDAKFSGIQYDLEPYTEFEQRQDPQVLTGLLETYVNIIGKYEQYISLDPVYQDFKLGFTIPFWFDGDNDYVEMIPHKGEYKFLFHHLVDYLQNYNNSYVALMSYRTKALGEDSIVQYVKTELDYILDKQYRIGIVVGQETGDHQPEKITYINLDKKYLYDNMESVRDVFASNQNFMGFAINDSSSFERLVEVSE